MHAITVSEYGGSPSFTELPKPQPGPGQVLIAVRAAGMNPMDVTIANGGRIGCRVRSRWCSVLTWRVWSRKARRARSGSRAATRSSASC